MKTRALVIAGLSVLIFFGAIWADHRGTVPVPLVPTAQGHCVLPTALMRSEHMMLLRQVREQIVRDDKNDRTDRLTNCIACHVQTNSAGAPIPINQRGQFCAACHTYVGVHLDCFACHATVPQKAVSIANLMGTKGEQAAYSIPRVILQNAPASLSRGHS